MSLKSLKAEIAATLRPLAEASTLAPQFYVDPQIYALESEQIFRASWISIGRVDQIAKPGDLLRLRCHGRARGGSAYPRRTHPHNVGDV
jgi:hypothetical protein